MSLLLLERFGQPPPLHPRPTGTRWFPWALLLWRSLHIDALPCARCASRMKILACLTGQPDRPVTDWPGQRISRCDGYSLHVGRPAPAEDREGLERLCRDVARPPVPDARLDLRADGHVQLALRRPYRHPNTPAALPRKHS